MADKEMTGISFRCTKMEMSQIENAAKIAGCSKSEFVREAVFNTINKVHDKRPAESMILTTATQLRMARQIAQLSVLAEKKLLDDDEVDCIEASRIRARSLVASTQDDPNAYLTVVPTES